MSSRNSEAEQCRRSDGNWTLCSVTPAGRSRGRVAWPEEDASTTSSVLLVPPENRLRSKLGNLVLEDNLLAGFLGATDDESGSSSSTPEKGAGAEFSTIALTAALRAIHSCHLEKLRQAMATEHPTHKLEQLASSFGLNVDSCKFAAKMDEIDPLRAFRAKFEYPKNKDLPLDREWSAEEGSQDCVYLCGHSLGLMPKSARNFINEQLEEWQKKGVMQHEHGRTEAHKPGAAYCDLPGRKYSAELVGAHYEHEVSLMNGLTVNLHLGMLAFYRPTEKRFKILIEGHAFPSDRYAVASLIRYNGLDPEKALVQLRPREGEQTLRTEDILRTIEEEGDSIAVAILSGVQYYTGQLFDIASITKAAQRKGCYVGWDLAHAIGNVKLRLHDWGVDFACWCSYKYCNSGAGGLAGFFLHDRYAENSPLHLHGWWGNREATRFNMAEKVELEKGAGSFRLSNPPPLLACTNYASLEVFHEAGMDRIEQKQFLLTGYLEYLLTKRFSSGPLTCTIITPANPKERGSQLSLMFDKDIEHIFKEIQLRGVMCDFRYPRVIRIAPCPLYNSFVDVRKFIKILKSVAQENLR